MDALREALDALRETSLCEGAPAPKHQHVEPQTADTLERCSAAPTLDWSREALRRLEPGAESYSVAFDVLIGARRGYLRNLGVDVVLKLGREALNRYLQTGSVALSDYLDIGEHLEPRVPDWRPSGLYTQP